LLEGERERGKGERERRRGGGEEGEGITFFNICKAFFPEIVSAVCFEVIPITGIASSFCNAKNNKIVRINTFFFFYFLLSFFPYVFFLFVVF
jgi:hypothetical protein